MSAWGAAEWQAFGQMLLGAGAVTAGFWSLFNYRRNRRSDAARWLTDVFRDFYLEDRFEHVRHVLEYEFEDVAGPLLERRITDRHVAVSGEDLRLLKELDDLLNYFEYVLYLEQEKHLARSDRQAVFEYWFDVLCADERASIRRYSAYFGFERVARALMATDEDRVVLYGSLLPGLGGADAPDLAGKLVRIGPCRIPGYLIDLGDYPGLVRSMSPGDEVVGEIYRVQDKAVFKLLDEFERYDAQDPAGSLYVRRLVRLLEPRSDAWTYIYNRASEQHPRVPDGDWRAYAEGADRAPGH
jgi:gamma-glutamylcyclotransferase (GGCT)/AIG2-like uncharacterized protein YtfP